MARKSFLVALFALLASFTFSSFASAQTRNQMVHQQGAISPDAKYNVNIAILLFQPMYNGVLDTPSGNVVISGVSGLISLTINAKPLTITFENVTENGRTFSRATIITKPYTHVDLKTGRRALAWAKVVSDRSTARGTIKFTVYSADDNSEVSGSFLTNGVIGTLNMVGGSTNIVF